MTKNPRGFASDNYAGIHPDVLRAIASANEGHEVAYGEDSESLKFLEITRELFGNDAVGFPVFNGTGANVIALQAATKRWEAVICADSAHIHADEGGAPEKMAGLKLWTVPTPDGKLTVQAAKSQIFDVGVVHRAQSGVISITQTTEMGTVYQPEEIAALANLAHDNGMLLHLDGARLSNAAAAIGKTFKEMTTDVGVDLVSLGGTKIGALAAEAVIVTNANSVRGSELSEAMLFLRKTSMQLASKMRFVSAQLNALFENNADVAIANGRHANAMAAILYAEIMEIAKTNSVISIPNTAQANAVFPIFPEALTLALQEEYRFYVWNQATGQVRLMCSWDTQESDVNGLVSLLRKLAG